MKSSSNSAFLSLRTTYPPNRGNTRESGSDTKASHSDVTKMSSSFANTIIGSASLNGMTDIAEVSGNSVGNQSESPKSSKVLVMLTGNIVEVYKRCNGKLSILDTRPQRILTNPSAPSATNQSDNKDGNLIVKVHDTIESASAIRYSVIDLLGVGTFGQVFRCQKEKSGDQVALKVIKNIPAYYNQGLLEIKIVSMLNTSYDPNNQCHIVRILDSFEFKSHICVVFELLNLSLLDVLTQNQYRGLPLTIIQRIARQLLKALVTLQDANIIHCDLKPENILISRKELRGDNPTNKNADQPKNRENSTDSDQGLTRESPPISLGSRSVSSEGSSGGSNSNILSDVKLIDFGSACCEGQTMFSYIQSRFYRAPEVLLGAPYNGAIDIWSFACVCVELYLGLPLFPGVSQHNQLTRIVEMFGQPPDSLISIGKNSSKYFVRLPTSLDSSQHGAHIQLRNSISSSGSTTTNGSNSTDFASNSNTPSQFRLKTAEEYARDTNTEVPILKKYLRYSRLEDVIMKFTLPGKTRQWTNEQKREEYLRRQSFLDFLNGLFRLHPFDRWTAKQAADHPFITNAPFTGSYQPPIDPKSNERKMAIIVQGSSDQISGNKSKLAPQTSPTSIPSSIPRPIQQQNYNPPQLSQQQNNPSNLHSNTYLTDRRRLSDPSMRVNIADNQSMLSQSFHQANFDSQRNWLHEQNRPMLKRGQPVLPRRNDDSISQDMTPNNDGYESVRKRHSKEDLRSLINEYSDQTVKMNQLGLNDRDVQRRSNSFASEVSHGHDNDRNGLNFHQLHSQTDSYQQIITQRLQEKQFQALQLGQSNYQYNSNQMDHGSFMGGNRRPDHVAYSQPTNSVGTWKIDTSSYRKPSQDSVLDQNRYVASSSSGYGHLSNVHNTKDSYHLHENLHSIGLKFSDPNQTYSQQNTTVMSSSFAHDHSFSVYGGSNMSRYAGGSMQEGKNVSMMTDFGQALLRPDMDERRRFQSMTNNLYSNESYSNASFYDNHHNHHVPGAMAGQAFGYPSTSSNGTSGSMFGSLSSSGHYTQSAHQASSLLNHNVMSLSGYNAYGNNMSIASGSSNTMGNMPDNSMAMSSSGRNNQMHISSSMTGKSPYLNGTAFSPSGTKYLNASNVTDISYNMNIDEDDNAIRKISASYHDSMDYIHKDTPLVTGEGFEHLMPPNMNVNHDDNSVGNDEELFDKISYQGNTNEMDVADWDPFFQTDDIPNQNQQPSYASNTSSGMMPIRSNGMPVYHPNGSVTSQSYNSVQSRKNENYGYNKATDEMNNFKDIDQYL